MIYSYKETSYYTFYLWREDQYNAASDGRGVINPRMNHFYPPKYSFGRDSHDGTFQKYQRQHPAPSMALFRSWDYPVGFSDGSFFVFLMETIKVGFLGPSTLPPKKLIFALMVRIFLYQ